MTRTPRSGSVARRRLGAEADLLLCGFPSVWCALYAHLPQPGFTDDNWAGTRALLELLSHEAGGAAVAEEMMAWMDEYHAGFVAAVVDDL